MALVERRIGELSRGIAAGFGATVEVDFRDIFRPLVNDAAETAFVAGVAAELVGEENVERNRSLVMASEDFSYMLEACPGAYIYIGNGDETGKGARPARCTIPATTSTTRSCRSAPATGPAWSRSSWRRSHRRSDTERQ